MKVRAIQERDNIKLNIKGAYGLTLYTFERKKRIPQQITFEKMRLQDLDLPAFSLSLKEYDSIASRWGLFYPLIKVLVAGNEVGILKRLVNNTNQGLLSITYYTKTENNEFRQFTIRTELPNPEDYLNMYNPEKLEKEKFLTFKDVINHLMNEMNLKNTDF